MSLAEASDFVGVLGFIISVWILFRDKRPIVFFDSYLNGNGTSELKISICHTNLYPILVERCDAYKFQLKWPFFKQIFPDITADGWETIDVVRAACHTVRGVSAPVNKILSGETVYSFHVNSASLPDNVWFVLSWKKPALFFCVTVPFFRFLSKNQREQILYAPTQQS